MPTPFTYRDLIRKYALDVAAGNADSDLTPRQRRLCQVMLNLASNTGMAVVVYPPTEPTRELAVRHLADIVWDARPLVEAASPRIGDDFSAALQRSIDILRAM